jgi:pimeloyl-ACP methyl ester carboxylesterase
VTWNVPHSEPARARVNGIEICYDTFGDRQAPAVLLIGGLGNQMIDWQDDFCTQLAERGYQVIRFDNRDTGLSTTFEHMPTPSLLPLIWTYLLGKPFDVPYTLEDMANDALGLLDELDIDAAHVVGASLGGMIAQMMAIQQPLRLNTLTSILSSTNDPGLPPPRPKTLILFKPTPQDLPGYIEHKVKVRRAVRGGGFPLDESNIRDHAVRLYERSRPSDGASRQMAAVMASAHSRRKQLKSISVPTLVIHGRADPLLPVKHGVHTAKVIPRAELLIIDGLGHELPPAVWPQVVEAIAHHAAAHA